MAVDNSKLIYGGDMMLFITDGSSGQTPIAFSTNAKITINMATRETSSKDSGIWKEVQGAKFDWSVTSDQLAAFDVSGASNLTNLYSTMVARSGVTMAFASKSGATQQWTVDSTKKAFTGTIYITSLDINSPDNDTVTYSMSATGSGELALA